ncbi:hypothetical protein [Emticicia agri]|nr:hypothetical protein [Emticicia agri]
MVEQVAIFILSKHTDIVFLRNSNSGMIGFVYWSVLIQAAND